jgi:iron complex outermembrane receptor protein
MTRFVSPNTGRGCRPANRWLSRAAAGLLLLFGAQSALLAQQGSVSGRVVDAELGEALVGAVVELLTPGGSVVRASTTGDDGAFRLSGIPAGRYSLVISTLGYDTYRQDRLGVGAEPITVGTVQLVSRALRLNPLIVTASRAPEKALEAPASVQTVTAEKIEQKPAAVAAEHVLGMPGVDNVTYGLQQHNVVARGFNNVFSGALFVLQDNRWVSVPSLRFNAYNLIPSTNDDIDRIELVLGPGSALYGPNVDKGVMHIITRSPLDYQGSAVSVLGGARDGNNTSSSAEGLFQGTFRTSNLISDNVGYKISGMYINGEDWHYVDPVEQSTRNDLIGDYTDAINSIPGLTPDEIADSIALFQDTLKIGNRDFQAERWAADARVDWRIAEGSTLIFSGGLTRMASSIEMTGIGSAQALNWTYWYGQARAQLGRLFAQAYINMSDAGDSFLLREGTPLTDNSFLFAGQLQHSTNLGERNRFVYGADLIRTVPRTEATIHGRNENSDNITELGGYVQWESKLSPMWDIVAAARLDWHSVTDGVVFSPRAGVVFKPTPEHNFRLTYNRAFSQPTSINFSLDLLSAPTLGPYVDYGVRVLGVPAGTGLTFRRDCAGDICLRSPFNPNGTAEYIDFDVRDYWDNAVDGVNQLLAARGSDPLDPALEALLKSLGGPGQDIPVGTVLSMFDQLSAQSGSLPYTSFTDDPSQIAFDVPALKPSITNTVEVGYKGLLAQRFLVGADVYWQKIQDFIGPLRFETPHALLDGADLAAYLGPYLSGAGLTPEQITGIIVLMSQVPLATAGWQQAPEGAETDLFLTYRNFGDVNLWGIDLGLTFLLTDVWSVSGSYSYVSDDLFVGLGNAQVDSIGDVALNAPQNKGTLGVNYDNQRLGLSFGLKGRYVQGYPVQSGVFAGDVPEFTVLDASIGYTLPVSFRTELVLDFRNFFSCVGESTSDPTVESGCGFGRTHQEIVGAPFIGSVITLRVRQPF